MIDVNHCFIFEKEDYFKDYWQNNNGLGGSDWDPDSQSIILRQYHQLLWSKTLPSGEMMKLDSELKWKDIVFGSDSIIVSFRYKNMPLAEEIKKELPNVEEYFMDYMKWSSTIGGYMIFPKHRNSINQRRGTNPLIRDRFDLTMECIYRYYRNEESPLKSVLDCDKEFFDLFNDFTGFCEFFFLQDCLNEDGSVKIWMRDNTFQEDALPKDIKEYFDYIEKEKEFLQKRNNRIKHCIQSISFYI